MFQSPKNEGVLQLGGIRYITLMYHANSHEDHHKGDARLIIKLNCIAKIHYQDILFSKLL